MSQGKAGKREITRAFGLSGDDRIALKHLLNELKEDNVINAGRKSFQVKNQRPSQLVAEIMSIDTDGDMVAQPLEWPKQEVQANTKPPRILVSASRGRTFKAPALRDHVLLHIDYDSNPLKGRIIRNLGREKTALLGVFYADPKGGAKGGGRVVSIDKKSRGDEWQVSEDNRNGAEEGDLVSVTLVRSGRLGSSSLGPAQVHVKERLGSVASEKAISLIAIYAHHIPYVFSNAALKEAELAPPACLKNREDWRDLDLVTIDPPDAKDHDDAVHAVPYENGFMITVAIADVAAYVRPQSALDEQAMERGNSVYFPDRVVPMLPERISNDLCSLKPDVDRPALAVRMVIDAQGNKIEHSFHRILMRSKAKLSYVQAQTAIDGMPDETTAPLLETVLKPLWAAYHCLAQARDERGPLFLDLPERKIILDDQGRVERVMTPPRLDAHRLIEEFMILANVAAAETLEKADLSFIYRAHDEPSLEKMRVLGEVLASIGIKLPKSGALRPALFNRILGLVDGGEHQAFVNEVVLRSQAQAEYTSDNYGHFGLNLRKYAHFTSPIRRYADLIVHRALIAALKLGKDGLAPDVSREQLKQVAEQISATERRAMAAERETFDRLIAHHLVDKIGATFEGRISGVTKSGLFVKLSETGADGFVPAVHLGADYYRYDENTHCLRGERTGETFRLGDQVSVKLVEAAPVAGALRFDIVSEGRFMKTTAKKTMRASEMRSRSLKKNRRK